MYSILLYRVIVYSLRERCLVLILRSSTANGGHVEQRVDSIRRTVTNVLELMTGGDTTSFGWGRREVRERKGERDKEKWSYRRTHQLLQVLQ